MFGRETCAEALESPERERVRSGDCAPRRRVLLGRLHLLTDPDVVLPACRHAAPPFVIWTGDASQSSGSRALWLSPGKQRFGICALRPRRVPDLAIGAGPRPRPSPRTLFRLRWPGSSRWVAGGASGRVPRSGRWSGARAGVSAGDVPLRGSCPPAGFRRPVSDGSSGWLARTPACREMRRIMRDVRTGGLLSRARRAGGQRIRCWAPADLDDSAVQHLFRDNRVPGRVDYPRPARTRVTGDVRDVSVR